MQRYGQITVVGLQGPFFPPFLFLPFFLPFFPPSSFPLFSLFFLVLVGRGAWWLGCPDPELHGLGMAWCHMLGTAACRWVLGHLQPTAQPMCAHCFIPDKCQLRLSKHQQCQGGVGLNLGRLRVPVALTMTCFSQHGRFDALLALWPFHI